MNNKEFISALSRSLDVSLSEAQEYVNILNSSIVNLLNDKDTLSVKGFGSFDMDPREVAHYFRDIFRLSEGCRFNNCTHTREPGCAVLAALDEHRLAPTRYASYLSMLGDKDENKYREAY